MIKRMKSSDIYYVTGTAAKKMISSLFYSRSFQASTINEKYHLRDIYFFLFFYLKMNHLYLELKETVETYTEQ